MEVMKPELIWVGNRCYRKNPCKTDYGITRNVVNNVNTNMNMPPGFTTGTSISVQPENWTNVKDHGVTTAPYVEADLYDCCEPDAPDTLLDEIEFNIEKLESGGYKTRCDNIPSSLFSVVIGVKGQTKKRIESETNTKIIVPRMNETGDIVIRGQRYQDVTSTRRRIELITSQARFKREATHFVSFPINFPHIVEKVREFKEKVLTEWKEVTGKDKNLFQEPEKIHLTLCVMMLLDQRERKLAENILENLKPEISNIISNDKLQFGLQGLEIMNDDPTEVNVLYAKCSWGCADAQKLADFICAKFVDSGLAKPNQSGNSVKFHATIMNIRNRQSADTGETQPRQNSARGKPYRKDCFDARNILKKFGDFDFGTGHIKEIHISTRHTTGGDGFYKSLAKITL